MAIEGKYLRNLLSNMGFQQDPDTPVYEDNTACIEWGNHVMGGRERAEHINIHFAHETIQNREMRWIKVDATEQLADLFTKALQYPRFLACAQGILNAPARVPDEVVRVNGARIREDLHRAYRLRRGTRY
jgi:hypothetical protein